MGRLVFILFWIIADVAAAQVFSLEQLSESNSNLVLTNDSTVDLWRLKYPVYRFCTADISGDGIDEALVGVIKKTKYFDKTDKRLFIYQNRNGKIDRLWMGSKIGGHIVDFGVRNGNVVCVSKTDDEKYSVIELALSRFGLSFIKFFDDEVNKNHAKELFWKLTGNKLCE